MSITLYPTITKTISNIPLMEIDTTGTSAQDYQLTPINLKDTNISVQISGMRYDIGNLSSEDIEAYVDVDGVNSPGEYVLDVKIKSKSGTSFDINEISPKTVKVTFDNLVEKSFTVEPQATNITAASGYLMEPVSAIPQTIKISGPKQEIEKITRVVVKTDLEQQLSESFSTAETDIVLYNGDTVIDKDPYTFETEDLTLSIPIYMQKTLPLSLQIQNTPRNFDLTSLKYSMSESDIEIAAPNTLIKDLGNIHLGYLDISTIDIGSSFEFPVLLENNYKNLSGFDKVKVDFRLDNYSSKTIRIDKSQLFFVNEPANYEVSFKTTEILNVKVIGPSNVIQNLKASDMIGEVDFV